MAQRYGDRWEIVEQLGQGGQGFTYLVKDTKDISDSKYVLKRMKNPKRAERFRREIESTRQLDHPNILKLIDFSLDTDKPYYVSQFCTGGSLASSTTPFGRNSPTKAMEVFLQICEGVAYAHVHNIVHRDLKPDNIYLLTAQGPAVIGDFRSLLLGWTGFADN